MTQTVELFFDIASPYSYLCATQIEGVAHKHGATVQWRPFLLGAVFKASGNGMPASVPAKASWMLHDLKAWARHYAIPFAFPSVFPANTVKALRACLAAGEVGKGREVALALFASYWVRGVDPASPEALGIAADAAGMDLAALTAAIESQPIKDALRANTDEAVARGAFGAPTMFVGKHMLWGNDRLAMLEGILERG